MLFQPLLWEVILVLVKIKWLLESHAVYVHELKARACEKMCLEDLSIFHVNSQAYKIHYLWFIQGKQKNQKNALNTIKTLVSVV